MTDGPQSLWRCFAAWYFRQRQAVDPFLRVLIGLRFHILIAAVIFAALFNEQAIEALVVAAEDAADPQTRRYAAILYGAGAVAILVTLMWYCARVLLYAFLPDVIDLKSPQGWFVRNAPRIVAVTPLFALSLALIRASASDLPTVPNSARILQGLAAGCIVLAILAYISWEIRRRIINKHQQQKVQPDPGEKRPSFTRRLAYLILALASMCFLFFAINPQFGGRIGALTVLLIAAALWVPFGTLLVYWGNKTRLPLLLILFGASLLWSTLDWNDNHEVRHRTLTPTPAGDLDSTFAKWLEGRPDRAQYKDSPYPVFIVATEGGGIYAATFTAAVLGSLQDAHPAFASHVFAISGVSGGSVGASIFAGLCSEFQRTGKLPQQTFQASARRVLDRDLLAPLLAGGLFPDVVQRFLPVAFPSFDRARALEFGLERAWRRSRLGPEFKSDFEALWPDFNSGSVPALLLNTTEVETGQRVVVTNLPLRDPRLNKLVSFRDKYPDIRMNLSTAAVLGARFPLVTPAGYLWQDATRKDRDGANPRQVRVKRRYVDGGYFENSGTATAAELLHALRLDLPADSKPTWSVTVIRIGFATGTASPDQAVPANVAEQPVTPARTRYLTQGLGEMLSPLRAMLNARSARGAAAVEQLRTLIRTLREHNRPASMVEFTLREEEVPIPLGWLLSNQAHDSIARQAKDSQHNRHAADAIGAALQPR